jgi:hypothetical protein
VYWQPHISWLCCLFGGPVFEKSWVTRLTETAGPPFAGKWMEVETIILSEVTLTQKDMHGMYSLISDIWKKMKERKKKRREKKEKNKEKKVQNIQDIVHRSQKSQQAESPQ